MLNIRSDSYFGLEIDEQDHKQAAAITRTLRRLLTQLDALTSVDLTEHACYMIDATLQDAGIREVAEGYRARNKAIQTAGLDCWAAYGKELHARWRAQRELEQSPDKQSVAFENAPEE